MAAANALFLVVEAVEAEVSDCGSSGIVIL